MILRPVAKIIPKSMLPLHLPTHYHRGSLCQRLWSDRDTFSVRNSGPGIFSRVNGLLIACQLCPEATLAHIYLEDDLLQLKDQAA